MGIKFHYQRNPFGSSRGLIARPFIPVYLTRDTYRSALIYALLDSGCDTVIFPADIAAGVGINRIETGKLLRTIGISQGVADVYYHDLAVQIAGDNRKLSMPVGFLHGAPLPLLGRTLFHHYKLIIFREAAEEVELVMPGKT